MSLQTYRKKRNFQASPEPRGGERVVSGNSFVIQKHAARRLHYDFRLEMDGVLKSWAVTRGPSLVPGEKRLAVHVEDHPIEYGGFEGSIPKGHYGAGNVIIWDRGTWQPLGDMHKAYRKGHLEFELDGEKLRGRWHLVRMAANGEKRENWLLIKGEDEAAREEGDPDILDEQPLSVVSGRDVDDAGDPPRKPARARGKGKDVQAAAETAIDPAAVKGSRKAPIPDFIDPELATLVKAAPKGKHWLHEVKFDGYRLQARFEGGKVRLLTRSGLDWTDRFGRTLVAELKALPVKSAILDGEVVVEGQAGASSFSQLQADLSEGRSDRFLLYLFDLLYLDGVDLRGAKLTDRKSLLRRVLPADAETLRYSEDFAESGEMVLRHACRLSLEGIVSKRADAPYRSGRGRDWVKSKCSARQELVIGGYVPSSVTRGAIGSLVMGHYDEKGRLSHAGRVGTGYSAAVAKQLYRTLSPLRQEESPFTGRLSAMERRDVVFVRPELVAEIEFRGWTADAHLRHASFRGLREDKAAREVVQETTAENAKDTPPKRSVALTHADRIYWPEAGVTKAGLADYYLQVWPFMAPFIVHRPLALLRCPEGIAGSCFFQKHAWQGMRKEIRQVDDPKESGDEHYVAIEDLDGLLGLVQGGVLEIHPWGSTLDAWEKPDMVNMDLDPGPDVSWERVIDAAREVRARFADIGLTGFVKTSGGKGLHIVAPLKPKTEWPDVKAAMKAVAEAMAADSAERYVATVSKAKRKGKILVDYLRNGRGATAVAPYSSRAREGAPVSMPLDWEELTPAIGPAHFTVNNASARLSQLSADPWKDFRAAEAVLKPVKPARRR